MKHGCPSRVFRRNRGDGVRSCCRGLCWLSCVVRGFKHPRPCAGRDWSSTESQMNDCAGERGKGGRDRRSWGALGICNGVAGSCKEGVDEGCVWGRVGVVGVAGTGVWAGDHQQRAPRDRDQPAWPAQRIAQGSCGGGLESERASEGWPHTRPDELDSSGDGGGAGPPERTLSAHSKELQWIPGSLTPCSPKPKPLLLRWGAAAAVVFAAAAGHARADGRRKRRNGSPAMARGGLTSLP